MNKVFLLFNDENAKNRINSLLLEKDDIELMSAYGEIEDILTQLHHFCADVILIENGYENCEFVIRQIKSNSKNQKLNII